MINVGIEPEAFCINQNTTVTTTRPHCPQPIFLSQVKLRNGSECLILN